jgi:hypothetical protein
MCNVETKEQEAREAMVEESALERSKKAGDGWVHGLRYVLFCSGTWFLQGCWSLAC